MKIEPFIPFEPIRTDKIPEGNQWIAQVKWDGVRILTYYDGKNVRLFNRKLNERTSHYPELIDLKSYCKAKTVILDGEVIALGADGKPSFHEVMRRDGIRRMERVEQVRQHVPVFYMIFDVVFCNGEWINRLTLAERNKVLSNIIMPADNVRLVTSYSDAKALFNVVQQQEMEGIVLKDINSQYVINGKDSRWQKKKNYQDMIAVVGGATLRHGIVNAVLLGLYDQEGRFWYIGHAGTGKLTASDWRAFTEKIQPLVVGKRPFVNKPERINNTIWIKPVITVKIQYIEWTKGRVIRQPSIQAFVNFPPEECILE
jgi:bifunctional non-homologous end joining protein LigD